jgi:hypothetical protein
MALLLFIWSGWLEPPVGTLAIFIGAYIIFVCVIILVFSLIFTSSQLANVSNSHFISRSN